jgi:acyl-CoA synthetase (AMP-forming)/AMP-acid ligase II
VAYVVVRQGQAADAGEIERFCLGQLARYKVPREYVFVDSLPKNAMGKIQHFRLKELIAEGPAGGSASAAATEEQADADSRPRRWQWLVGGRG